MPTASEIARSKVFRSVRPIPRVREHAEALRRIHGVGMTEPLVLDGFARGWPACAEWDEARLLERYGSVELLPTVGLPDHGVPYLAAADGARQRMTLRAFWKVMGERGSGYVDQTPLSRFPGGIDDVPIAELLGGQAYFALNLWLGRGTKSGLHFDEADNFLVMVRGTKLAVLARPEAARDLHPFPGLIAKSQIDVERPDAARFPNVVRAEVLVADLAPGDVLSIPRRWWHYLASPADDWSLSLNCWFGAPPSIARHVRELLEATASLGPRYAGRLVRDFLVHGVAARPFVRRNYSAPPDGFMLYRVLRESLRRSARRRTPSEARPA